MKTSELMIGDLLYLNRRPVRVDAIGFNGSISYSEKGGFGGIGVDKLSPIPITEEILVKNGFEKCYNDEAPVEECYFFRLFNKQCGWLDIDAFGLEEELGAEFTYHDVNINYVHQLQHLLRLCGIEKEIEL